MTKDQRPVCSRCQTPMVRYNVPHTGDKEQAWRLACSCKHSAASEVIPSNPNYGRKVPDFFGRLYTDDQPQGSAGTWVRRAEVDALLDEIARLRTTIDTLHLNLQIARRESPVETPAPQAPIAKITVQETGWKHDLVTASLYAPGLPPGEYDVYLDPAAPGIRQVEPEAVRNARIGARIPYDIGLRDDGSHGECGTSPPPENGKGDV